MIADSRTSVAFTGHRTYRGAAADALRRTVGELYARGFRNFLSGMAVGFDLAAAEAIATGNFDDQETIGGYVVEDSTGEVIDMTDSTEPA